MSRRVIEIAYRETKALGIPCPACYATVGEYCTRRDDSGAVHVRRIPCHLRMQPVDAEVVDIEPETVAVDFGEPRHNQEKP